MPWHLYSKHHDIVSPTCWDPHSTSELRRIVLAMENDGCNVPRRWAKTRTNIAAPPNAGNSSQSLSLSGQATFIEHHREPWSKDNKPWFFATFPVNAVNRWRRPWRESSQQVTRTKVLSNPIRISSLLDLLVGGHWKKISLREIVTKQASGQSVLIWNSQAIDKLKRNTLPEWKQHKTYVLWLVPILIKPSASGSFGAPKQKASKSSALFQPDGIPLPLEGMMS